MARRIIAQCSTADFKYLQECAEKELHGEKADLSHPKRTQYIASLIVNHFIDCGVPLRYLLRVREVLVWEDDNKQLYFEYRLIDPRDRATALVLRLMKSKKKER